MGVSSTAKDLARIFPGQVQVDVPLDQISHWKIGGTADVVVTPNGIEELSRLRSWLAEKDVASVVIGATSNLLFSDEGLRSVVVRIGSSFADVAIEDDRLVAGAGAWVPGVARRAMHAGLSGIEHTCGIPGTLGGLVVMNGGSQRKGIGDHVQSVVSIDATGALVRRTGDQCGFAYRASTFQQADEVICSVTLQLGPPKESRLIRQEILGILRDRRLKFPRKQPNCGSVFVSNPAMYEEFGPPGKVIEISGLKGMKLGDSQVSPLHANFIVNLGRATARDTLSLIRLVRDTVYEKTGYLMESEVRFVRPDGSMMPAHRAQP